MIHEVKTHMVFHWVEIKTIIYQQAFPPGYPVTRVFLVSRLKFAILSRTIEVPASLSSFFPIPAFSRY